MHRGCGGGVAGSGAAAAESGSAAVSAAAVVAAGNTSGDATVSVTPEERSLEHHRHPAHHHHHHHHHHNHHHHHPSAMPGAPGFHWGAMLAGHHAAAAAGMMQPPLAAPGEYAPAHHHGATHPAMPMDLHVHQGFPYYRYRDDALCWTDSILELRKEKSRDAARSRRGKENFEFYELAKMLPLPAAITSQLDKASIIRLTISYLKLRDFSGHGDPPWSRDGPPPNKTVKGTNRVRSAANAAVDHFEVHQGTHILQSLDGFAMAVAADGRFLYISETVSIYLGLSQVEMTGSSVFDYVHQQDHAEVAEQLGLGLASSASSSGPHSSSSGLASPSSAASEEHGSSSTANPDVSSLMSLSASGLYKGYDRAFCVRMKSTLTKRGCHFKSSGYRVVLLLCRLRPQYTFSHTRKTAPPLMGMVGLAIALPPPSVHEIRLETDMFVTRINFDFRIAHCEPKWRSQTSLSAVYGRLSISKGVSELLDYTADELTGKNLYTLCHGEDANRLRKSHIDLIHKGQVLTHYYRLMNKSGGYTWLQTCATVVCNSKNAEEQNIICVNYVISGREYENLIMDCCQLEDGVTGVKREDATGNDPENGSPDADRGEGRSRGGPTNQHQEHPHRSPPEDREDTRGSESEKRGNRHHDSMAQLQQEPQAAIGNISTLVVKLRGHKRKLQEEESSSNEEDEEEEVTEKVANNERNNPLSPTPSNHSISTNEQVLCATSPKSRRSGEGNVRSGTTDVTENSGGGGGNSNPGSNTGGTDTGPGSVGGVGATAGASVKDLEQAMSKHLPGTALNKSNSPSLHQPTDFSTDALLKQQQQRSTIQWIGAHHHLGHLSPQQSATAPLPASALLRQLYANRESVIRANVHGITSAGGARTPSSGGSYYASETGQNGPLPTPPGSEGSSTYGEHQFILTTHNQKASASGNSCGTDAFTSLVSSYSTAGGYAVDYHSAMTPPSSVSPRDKQQQQQHHHHHHHQQQPQQQQQQQQQQQLHPVNVISSYDTSSTYGEPVLRHQYEPAQPLPLKPQVYSATVHPSALDAAAAYASAGLGEQAQFYHHPAAAAAAAAAGFHIYHPSNKATANSWYGSTS
ncbi:protein trachealess-like isoform X5 [Vespa mandarinia]|uniref:protein trachealess-like isoform X5 n=1 Tax=Vespa mandarinia TaxID=7446 RepID=UPI0016071281|nr:protein trachealess-like isoform X5 [Vespa mandarinia]